MILLRNMPNINSEVILKSFIHLAIVVSTGVEPSIVGKSLKKGVCCDVVNPTCSSY